MRRNKTVPTSVTYLTPAVALLVLIYGYPIYNLIELSTQQSLGPETQNVGLLNFHLVLHDPIFRTAITNTARLLACVPLTTVGGIFGAILLFEQTRGRRLFLYLLMVPFCTSIAVTGIAFANVLTDAGALNSLLSDIGLGGLRHDWLGNPKIAIWSIGAVIVWQQTSFAVVIFYARLMSVSRHLYEAAHMDGATWTRRHWHVTLPELRSSLVFYITFGVITIVAWIFPYVFIITRGGPGNATTTTDLYIYNDAFAGIQTNLAAAAAVLLLLGFAAIGLVAAAGRAYWKWK